MRGEVAGVESALRAIDHVTQVDRVKDGATATYVVESAPGTDTRERIAAAVVGGGFGLLELRPVGLSLEDVFIRLVTREDIEG